MDTLVEYRGTPLPRATRGDQVVMLHGWTRVMDNLSWSRFRWLFLGGLITALLLALGGEYAIGGKRVVASVGAHAVFSNILPGGVRGHGVIMLAIGFTLLLLLADQTSIAPRHWRVLRWVLWVAAGYFLWTATLFALAPTQPGGVLSWPAVTLWALLAGLPIILSTAPPPSQITSDEVRLVQLAQECGLSAGQAKCLSEKFFLGDSDDRA